MGVFFFCGLRCFCLWKLRRDINGDKDAGCVFWFRRIKAFTQTKCGPISGCKFSSQIKAFPFSHPQVGYFITAVDNDEMCVFAAHLRFFLGRNAIYGSWDTNLWSLPRFVAWFDHRGQDLNGVYNERFGHGSRILILKLPTITFRLNHRLYIKLAKMFANMPIFGRYLCVYGLNGVLLAFCRSLCFCATWTTLYESSAMSLTVSWFTSFLGIW